MLKTTSPHPAVQGDREWGLWSVYPGLFLQLLSERSVLPLLQRGVPPSGEGSLCESIPQATVLHKLLQFGSPEQAQDSPRGTGQCGCRCKSEEECGKQPCRMRSGELGRWHIEYAESWGTSGTAWLGG